ncbi:putative AraC-type DNA-binding domain-containing protein [Vibrio nigripulchritudo SFn27]|uniref:Putative AraC-type DNA-binding domain-containing protein n=1 Tax=Vibrio nigripulchritudo TaxID=28173 RepID=U4KCA5_9VIBR|nr:AraC family transcriptional regulator [Vibrio nigripulchritudo]CCN83415.1 putative AraC-type DNA-binding domain-containing protein [Vibrio nigripulchritudo BLFn1]CCN88774.1 putative AraC-type DNA-binding domain-containing protein [Vibrio nigripulchritudo SFn27]CCN94997.1 putative AraC-type DNA-binding domain-containing protein [Vibrio nigripulchritudo ENn2]CCO41119.1 putative AraC-type DNA-binding domain-containing protein [Vibrio nigripulchritudo SFn135]CCO52436.1 putative AraC-type DNA-bi
MQANRFYLGDHYSVFTGYLSDIPLHKHTTGAVCISLGASMKIGEQNQNEPVETKSVFVPQNHMASFQFSSQPVLIFCFEVESHFYEQFQAHNQYSLDRISAHLDSESELIQFAKQLTSEDNYRRENTTPLCQILASVTPVQNTPQVVDPRLIQVVREIDNNLEDNQELDQLAELVHLSPGRLGHIFREHTGMPVRRYRIWRRLRKVIELYVAGKSMTEAAIEAGFSDSSHFSSSCKKLLGLSPSQLLHSENKIELYTG